MLQDLLVWLPFRFNRLLRVSCSVEFQIRWTLALLVVLLLLLAVRRGELLHFDVRGDELDLPFVHLSGLTDVIFALERGEDLLGARAQLYLLCGKDTLVLR